ncbi:uncharacterized protein LOC110944315 isoform X3 [Helianthus annuus]|uniref:uncharacterized protein LOC110944315 isoform X3 n=1 Tax=Helianthus annuus TaxID=4232 RepID=UPI001652D1C5|nr:uncharacterized protein LOC110944315 isoform X3 [Helianthus annuus]
MTSTKIHMFSDSIYIERETIYFCLSLFVIISRMMNVKALFTMVKVEFRSSLSSSCIRTSRALHELSITRGFPLSRYASGN